LRGLVGAGVAPARMLTRACILLKADHGGGPGWSDAAVAGALDVNPSTVLRGRRRFVTDGLPAALERKRPGVRGAPGRPGPVASAAPRRRTGPPGGRGRRLPRDGAPDAQNNDLQPWLSAQWCLAPTADPAFVWHREDVRDVSERPPDPARPVVCLDETSRQLLGEARHRRRQRPAAPPATTPSTRGAGSPTSFLLTEPLRGWRTVLVSDQRTRLDFARCGRELVDVHYPQAERVVLVLDQLNTHSPASLSAAFPAAEAKRLTDRLEIHHTPKRGSWLNIAEIDLGVLERQCLRRRIDDREALERETATWAARRNAAVSTID